MPGFAFPTVGPLGLGSPPSQSGIGPQTFGTMQGSRLPPGPSRIASLLARFPLPCASSNVRVPFPAHSQAEAPPSARSFVTPVHLTIRLASQGDRWLSQVPELPLWRHAPLSDPGGVPQRIARAASGTAAFHPLHGVGFPPSCKSAYPNGPRLYLFRGSITRPAFSLPPASYTPSTSTHAVS
jgi:hypothetical protein